MKTFGPLVNAAWLKEHASDSDVRIVDLRWYLSGKRGDEEYARGHVPGAVFLDLEKDLTARVGPGRHPIPGAGQVERAMRRAGVDGNTRVVIYDDAGGSIAARLWFLLGYYGHKHAAVLDGGLQAWSAAGGALDTATPTYPEGEFNAGPPDSDLVVDKDYVREERGRADLVLLDARAPERYRGETEPVDARPGHIPGARSAFWGANLKDGRFAEPPTLRARYEALGATPGREVLVYCGSGVTACHDLLALSLAGIDGARLYEGSYSDWARDASLPVATGEE